MPRLNNANELQTAIDSGGIIRDQTTSPASDSLAAAATAGDTTLTLNAASTFADNDLIRVGAGNQLEVAEIESGGGTTTLTLKSGLVEDHAIGAVVFEQVKVDLGDVSEDGVSRESSTDRNEFRVATQAGIYAVLVTSAEARLSWNLVNHSLENVLVSLGIPETNITGAGTVADPFVADLDPDAFATSINESLFFTGTLKDGTTFEVRGFNCDWDPNQTMSYARGNPALLPIAADVSRMVYIQPIS